MRLQVTAVAVGCSLALTWLNRQTKEQPQYETNNLKQIHSVIQVADGSSKYPLSKFGQTPTSPTESGTEPTVSGWPPKGGLPTPLSRAKPAGSSLNELLDHPRETVNG
jgi:hypothetical protein